MNRIEIPLENVRIASPCPVDWDAMQGDNRARFCPTCAKNVYNLSNMSRQEAEILIAEKEGNLCALFYQRADGTMLTQDCPVGLSRLGHVVVQPFKWLAAGVALLMASGVWICGALGKAGANDTQPLKTAGTVPSRTMSPAKAILKSATPQPTRRPRRIMGKIRIVPPTPAPTHPKPKLTPKPTSKSMSKPTPKPTPKKPA